MFKNILKMTGVWGRLPKPGTASPSPGELTASPSLESRTIRFQRLSLDGLKGTNYHQRLHLVKDNPTEILGLESFALL